MQETFLLTSVGVRIWMSLSLCFTFYFENLDVSPCPVKSFTCLLLFLLSPVYLLKVSVFVQCEIDSSSVWFFQFYSLCVTFVCFGTSSCFWPVSFACWLCYLGQVWLPFVVWTFCCIKELELWIKLLSTFASPPSIVLDGMYCPF